MSALEDLATAIDRALQCPDSDALRSMLMGALAGLAVRQQVEDHTKAFTLDDGGEPDVTISAAGGRAARPFTSIMDERSVSGSPGQYWEEEKWNDEWTARRAARSANGGKS